MRAPQRGRKTGSAQNCRLVSKIFLTFFDDFWRFLPCAKMVEKCRKYFWHFLTIFDFFWRGPFPMALFAVHLHCRWACLCAQPNTAAPGGPCQRRRGGALHFQWGMWWWRRSMQQLSPPSPWPCSRAPVSTSEAEGGWGTKDYPLRRNDYQNNSVNIFHVIAKGLLQDFPVEPPKIIPQK